MTLSIQLPTTDEAWLQAEATRLGLEPAEVVRNIVHERVSPIQPPVFENVHERIRAMDQLAAANQHAPVLPIDAFERESLYDDRL